VTDGRAEAQLATASAERFSELAEIAELMDDADGASRFRRRAERARARAMLLLDE
jgi:hypothetical protein